ncbi:MAG: hypothetical protein ACPK85_12575 [Methanosarcina sp.]
MESTEPCATGFPLRFVSSISRQVPSSPRHSAVPTACWSKAGSLACKK